MSTQTELDPEILAITTVYSALKELDAPAQVRVVEYVLKKLNLSLQTAAPKHSDEACKGEPPSGPSEDASITQGEVRQAPTGDEFAGISPVAQRWMQRNGFRAEQLTLIFSVGGDEIDLVANKVPGKSTRARMRSVFLLKGVAAYLAGGAPRFPHDKAKETCMHYDAYDGPNFSTYLKGFAPEISGSKESGYTLTPRGLTGAVTLLKEMVTPKQAQ